MAEAGGMAEPRSVFAEMARTWTGFCSDGVAPGEKLKDKITKTITYLKPKCAVANLGWRRPYIAVGDE